MYGIYRGHLIIAADKRSMDLKTALIAGIVTYLRVAKVTLRG